MLMPRIINQSDSKHKKPNRKSLDLTLVVTLINKGYTWEDVVRRTGYGRAYIQRKLKSEYFSTVEGYKYLLNQAHENSKSKNGNKKGINKIADEMAIAKTAANDTAKNAANAKHLAEMANAEVVAFEQEANQADMNLKTAKEAARKAAKAVADAEMAAQQAKMKLKTAKKAALAADQKAIDAEMAAHQTVENVAEVTAHKNTKGKFLLTETGPLYDLAASGHGINHLFQEFQIVLVPEGCIREIEKAASTSNHNHKLRQIAKSLLEEITQLGHEFFVIEDKYCTSLLYEPVHFQYPVKERSRTVVGALCHIWNNNNINDSTITLHTASKEIRLLACCQKFPREVSIIYKQTNLIE